MAHNRKPGESDPIPQPPASERYTALVDQQQPTVSHEDTGAVPESASPLYETLFHDRVLRPGWGLLIFVGLVVALGMLLLLLIQALQLFHVSSDTTLHLSYAPINLAIFGAVLLSTVILASVEHRHVVGYGLSGRRWLQLSLGGSLSAALSMCALIDYLHRAGDLVFRGQTLFGLQQQVFLGAGWAGFFLLAAVVEEMLTLGYLQYTLTRGLASLLRNHFGSELGVDAAFWLGALLLLPLFLLLHAAHRGENYVGFAAAGAYSLLLAFSLWRTGSIWWAVGFHFAWDWTQGFVFGSVDSGLLPASHFFFTQANGPVYLSGGSTGPEGSILSIAAYLLGAGLLLLTKKRKVYPELWAEAEQQRKAPVVTLPDPG